MELYEVKAMLTADIKSFTDGLGEALNALSDFKSGASELDAISSSMVKVGAGLTAGLTVPLVGVGAVSAKTFMGLDENLRRTMATMGEFVDETGNFTGQAATDYETLKTKSKEWGQESIYTSEEVAGAMAVLASRGADMNGILEQTPGVINLAAATGMKGASGIENAAHAVGSAMQQFNEQGMESTHVANVFARAAADTALQQMDLANGLRYVGVSAATNGIAFEETAAALGVMANSGLRSEQAGRYLNMALTKMAKPTKEAQEVMDALGISFYDSEGNMKSLSENTAMLREAFTGLTDEQRQYALATMFGQQAGRGMNVLIDETTGKLETLTENFINSEGAAENMANTINSGISGALEKMMEAITNAFATIGEILAPTLIEWAQHIENLMEKFNALDPATQEMIVTIGALVAAIGPLTMAFGLLIKPILNLGVGLGQLIGFLIVNPWVAFAAAAVAAVVLIVQNWESIAEFFSNLWETIKSAASSAWEAIKTTIEGVWNNIKASAKVIWEGVKGAIVVVWTAIKTVASTTWNDIKTTIETIWNNIKTSATEKFNAIKDTITKAWDNVKTKTKEIWDNLKKIISDVINDVKKNVKEWVDNLKKTISDGWANLVKIVTEKGSEIVESVRTAWDNAIAAAREFISSAISVGRDIIGGFISGVTEKARELASAAANAVSSAISAAKGALGIRSPSRVFMDIGDDTMAGFIIGIGDRERETMKTMGNLIGNVIDEADKAELDFASKLSNLNSSVSSNLDYTIKNNSGNRIAANISLTLGNREFRTFVEDISNTQGQEAQLVEAYGY